MFTSITMVSRCCHMTTTTFVDLRPADAVLLWLTGALSHQDHPAASIPRAKAFSMQLHGHYTRYSGAMLS